MSPASLRGPARELPALFCLTLLSALLATSTPARAQGIGAHRGDPTGSGGSFNIEGRIISPLGKLPETRVRVLLEHTDSPTRTAVAGDDGTFFFSNLEGGTYTITIDAGKEYEPTRESVYIEEGKVTYNVPIYLRLKPESNPALAGVPKPALDLFSKALEAERKGDNAKAASLLADALTQYPQFGLAHGELGMLYFKTGQVDKAVEELKAAQKAVPDDPQVQMNYGVVLLEKKDYAEAEKQLRRAAKKMDKSAQLHMYLGVAVMRQKGGTDEEAMRRLDDAERELLQSVKLGGDPAGRVHYYLGGIYWGEHKYKKAADELELYVKQSPKAPDAEQVRASIKELRGKS
jgi:tetratricopeptide (TPR) repeat protein